MATTVRGRDALDLDANKTLVRSFVEAWNTRDFDRFDALMSEGAVLHIGGGQLPCDPAATRAIAQEWTSAFPDWRFELLRLVAEGLTAPQIGERINLSPATVKTHLHTLY